MSRHPNYFPFLLAFGIAVLLAGCREVERAERPLTLYESQEFNRATVERLYREQFPDFTPRPHVRGDGVELVRREFSQLYEALMERAGEAATEEFLRLWTRVDLDHFRAEIHSVLTQMHPSLPTVPSVEQLYLEAGGQITGALGEIFGTALLRAHFSDETNPNFLDEDQYKRWNPEGRKPDGLFFTRMPAVTETGTRPGLLINLIFESKIGIDTTYDPAQAASYLARWKDNWLQIGDTRGNMFFRSQIMILFAGRLVPLVEVFKKDLQRATVLVSSQPERRFEGFNLVTPMDASVIREVGYALVDKLAGRRPTATFVPLAERKAEARSRVQAEVTTLASELKNWMVAHRQWPKSSGDAKETYLRKQISLVGGQGRIFKEVFTAEIRHELALVGMEVWPNIGHVQSFLDEMDPRDPDAIQLLFDYVMVYENDRWELRKTPEIVERLSRRSQRWAEYFRQHTSYDFYDLRPCAKEIENKGKDEGPP